MLRVVGTLLIALALSLVRHDTCVDAEVDPAFWAAPNAKAKRKGSTKTLLRYMVHFEPGKVQCERVSLLFSVGL